MSRHVVWRVLFIGTYVPMLGVLGSMLVAVLVMVGVPIEAHPTSWIWNHPGAFVGVSIGFAILSPRYLRLKEEYSARQSTGTGDGSQCPECETIIARLGAKYCPNCGAEFSR